MFEGKKCIVRCYGAGVFFAEIESMEGKTAMLRNARRLWYWNGAASLSQLAMQGVKYPKDCKFTVTVPSMAVTDVVEVIPCTDEAIDSINKVTIWQI